MAPREEHSERAERLVHNYYDYLSSTPWISPIVSSYEKTKHSHVLMEEGLGKMETTLLHLSTIIISTSFWSLNNLYLAPKRKIGEAVTRVIDGTTRVVRTTVDVVVNVSTLSIGLGVVAAQYALTLLIGGTSIGLDGIDEVKRQTRNGVESIRDTTERVKTDIRERVDSAVKFAMIPVEITGYFLHSVLDLIEGLVENRMEMPVVVSPTASLLARISAILTAISNGLKARAHSHVIDPAHAQVEALIDKTKHSLVVLEAVKERGYWAVAEKVDNLSTTAAELKRKIEEEARKYRVSPEVILLRGIQTSTKALTKNLRTLKEKNTKVFGDDRLFDGALYHLDKMQTSLKEKRDIYEVRDELITQTRNVIDSLSHSMIQ
ncbi:hypothetical protein PFISCL1PPCAC_5211 [Pristionchus fissidentatus]|uniref:Uncharacterized protein n=1 Tax=Pristionchus fissidentatus TaxID=1538716 RepID=A0AAV5V7N3_9BILA|nr:hypothetical protein PFISCL1PPCAC_5211 [Pristionchus fissidentatus]